MKRVVLPTLILALLSWSVLTLTTHPRIVNAQAKVGEALIYHNDSSSFTTSPLPAVARVTGSNATTTGQSLVDVTGLSLALQANSVYQFDASLAVASSSTAGNEYGVQFSAAGATVEARLTGTLLVATQQASRISALNTATIPYATLNGDGAIWIDGVIVTGVNAGNLTIRHLKVTSGTSTVRVNSYLKVQKL